MIEAVIGTALLVIVGVAVLVGITTAFKASATTDKISTALSIAQSQIEYIQTQEYICVNTMTNNAAYLRIDDATRLAQKQDIPTNYTISSLDSTNTEVPSVQDTASVIAVAVDENDDISTTGETGLQRITLIIRRINDTHPLTLVAYKVKPTTEACP